VESLERGHGPGSTRMGRPGSGRPDAPRESLPKGHRRVGAGDRMTEPPTSSADLAAPRARDQLLATKLSIPRPRPDRLARARLFQRLDEGMGRGLVLVCAPAGFGKTTLLADWATSTSPAGCLAVAGPRRQRPGPLLALHGRGPGSRPRRPRRAPSPAHRAPTAVGPGRGNCPHQPAPGQARRHAMSAVVHRAATDRRRPAYGTPGPSSPRLLPRNATVGSCIRASSSAGRTRSPLCARPSPRWNRAQPSWSAAEDTRPPPGCSPRQRRHSRATWRLPS